MGYEVRLQVCIKHLIHNFWNVSTHEVHCIREFIGTTLSSFRGVHIVLEYDAYDVTVVLIVGWQRFPKLFPRTYSFTMAY